MKTRAKLHAKAAGAGLAAVLLATLGLFGAGTAASAAPDEIVVDQEFVFDGVEGASLDPRGSRFAQPFIPQNSGALDSITLEVWTVGEYELSSVSIHTITEDDEISADPIPGGSGTVSIATWPNNPDVATATAKFSARPQLSSTQRYVFIVDPRPASDPTNDGGSFPMEFGGGADYALMVAQGDTWGTFWITGHIYFSIRYASPAPLVELVPEAPTVTPGATCGTPGIVNIPEQEHVRYEQVGDSDEVTVTAFPHDGYAFTTDAVREWKLNVAATPCPPELTTVTPSAPTLTKATCETPGKVSVPDVAGISYDVSGSLASTRVVATPQDGFAFPVKAQTQWVYDLSALKCGPTPPTDNQKPQPVEPLAHTGAESSTIGVTAGVALASVGLLSIVLVVIRRNLTATK